MLPPEKDPILQTAGYYDQKLSEDLVRSELPRGEKHKAPKFQLNPASGLPAFVPDNPKHREAFRKALNKELSVEDLKSENKENRLRLLVEVLSAIEPVIDTLVVRPDQIV